MNTHELVSYLSEKLFDSDKNEYKRGIAINFRERSVRYNGRFIIENGTVKGEEIEKIDPFIPLPDLLSDYEDMYLKFKYSYPNGIDSRFPSKYFKALTVDEMTEEELCNGEDRYQTRIALELSILVSVLDGTLYWNDEDMGGKWFYQSKTTPDFILMKEWIA